MNCSYFTIQIVKITTEICFSVHLIYLIRHVEKKKVSIFYTVFTNPTYYILHQVFSVRRHYFRTFSTFFSILQIFSSPFVPISFSFLHMSPWVISFRMAPTKSTHVIRHLNHKKKQKSSQCTNNLSIVIRISS